MKAETTSSNDLSQAVLASDKTLAEYVGISPNALKVIYANAVGHLESGHLEQAAVEAFQLVSLDPRCEDYWALYGNIFMKLGCFAQALTAWEMAMVCAPRFSTAATIARTAIAIEKFDNAAEALLMARRYRSTPAQELEFDALVDAWYAARG